MPSELVGALAPKIVRPRQSCPSGSVWPRSRRQGSTVMLMRTASSATASLQLREHVQRGIHAPRRTAAEALRTEAGRVAEPVTRARGRRLEPVSCSSGRRCPRERRRSGGRSGSRCPGPRTLILPRCARSSGLATRAVPGEREAAGLRRAASGAIRRRMAGEGEGHPDDLVEERGSKEASPELGGHLHEDGRPLRRRPPACGS